MHRAPSLVERGLARLFGDDEPTTFGTGWMAGTGGAFLGVLPPLHAAADLQA